MSEPGERYPGSDTPPEDLCQLADQYRIAAAILDQFGPRGSLASAPFRLTALHAIDLYLNAVLLHAGHSSAEVRALHHRSGRKLELAMDAGFNLDKGTAGHILELEQSREYLVSRYDPTSLTRCSQTNRVAATLRKLGNKVRDTLAA